MTSPHSSAAAPWHVAPADLERYARGRVASGHAASIETHLAACSECQAAMAQVVRTEAPDLTARLSLVLDDVVDSVDAVERRPLERTLVRVGVREHVARLLSVSPQVERSWLFAVLGTLVFTVVATRTEAFGVGLFLVVAPLLPLAVVAAAFAMSGPQMSELVVTMPVRASWLLLIRSVSVVVPTFAMCGLAAIAVPSHGWETAAWILPALALSTMAAALSTWIKPVTAAVGLMAGWLVVLFVASGRMDGRVAPGALIDQAAVFAPAGQLIALALACASLLVLFVRRDTLDTRSLV